MSATATTPTSSATAALSAYNAAYASSYAQRYAQLGKSTLDRETGTIFQVESKLQKKSCLGPRRFFEVLERCPRPDFALEKRQKRDRTRKKEHF